MIAIRYLLHFCGLAYSHSYFINRVFRNGDENYHGARVLLPRNIMGSWEHVLQLITFKAELVTPVKRLCTLDARVIHAVSEIQDGGKYVALEGCKAFQNVAYCSTGERSIQLLRLAYALCSGSISHPRSLLSLSLLSLSSFSPLSLSPLSLFLSSLPLSLLSLSSLYMYIILLFCLLFCYICIYYSAIYNYYSVIYYSAIYNILFYYI